MVQQSVIRKMTYADVPVICQIDHAVDPAFWSDKLFSDCIKVGYETWVICIDFKVIGFAVMSYGANEAHLLKIAIDTIHQHQGLGQKLLSHIIATAKVHGSEEMYLEVRVSNVPAIKLYQKNHFVEVGVRKAYYPPNGELGIPAEDGLTMALPLW